MSVSLRTHQTIEMSQSNDPEYILASFPRSANHWVRYIIEFLSKQPTLGEGNRNRDRKDPPIFKNLGRPEFYASDQPIAVKRHSIRKEDDRSKKLIFVIRDYREVIYRHLQGSFSIFKIPEIETNVRKYVDLIKQYHGWPSKKLLIHYEDLIDSPEETISRIADFIGHKDQLSELLGDLETHQKRCVSLYDEQKGSQTKGKASVYHSTKYGDGWKRYLDWRVKKTYDSLF